MMKKTKIFQKLLKRRGRNTGVPKHQIERVDRSTPLRPSFAQEWLWFLDQLEGSTAYHIPICRWLRGSLDVNALKHAFDEIIRRHEVLRTTLEAKDGSPHQVIHPPGRIPLLRIDLLGLSAEAAEKVARRLATEEAERPFDLAKGPLIRLVLVQLESRVHLLIVNLHHIAVDGWSVGVLNREMMTLYNAFVAGEPSTLPDLPVQYADYAAWQRRFLVGEELKRRLDYWRGQLDGIQTLELPLDRPRPPVTSHKGSTLNVQLSGLLVKRLEALSRQEGATMFMLLLAAFKLVLSRHTGQDDVLVGTPVSDRSRQELEGLIGFFVNPVILRTDLAGDPSFRELVSRVRDTTIGAFAHAELPFKQLVAELRLERDLSRTPVFQVQFSFHNFTGYTLSLQGIDWEFLGETHDTSQQELEVYASAGSDVVDFHIKFAADLFERSTIERMFDHYRTVLEQVVEDPDRKLSRLRLSTDEEAQQIPGGGGSLNDGGAQALFPDLFSARVKATPDAPAVLVGDEMLTFQELARAAGQLAGALVASGTEPGAVVGICPDASIYFPVGIVATLRAGMPFAVVEPTISGEELEALVEQSGLNLLLTDDSEVETLARDLGIATLSVHHAGDVLDVDGQEVQPEQVAWFGFTSGKDSPRGNAVSHRVVASQLRAIEAGRHVPGPGDVSCLWAPRDTSHLIWGMLGPLVNGAAVAVACREELCSVVAERDVTWLCLTPFWLRELLAEGVELSMLRLPGTVIVTGEALAPGLVRRWFERNPAARLLHAYSVSEAGVVALGEVEEVPDTIRVPVGLPVSGARVHVLDRQLSPSPAGIAGEICVGGAGHHQCSIEAPGREAETFVPDPRGESGGQLLRTGDLGRYLGDGRLEVWGPRSRRVRVRGFEVDLDYLDGCVCDIDGVKHAAVVEDDGLVAHVVAADGETPPDETSLREGLENKVSGYMLPERLEIWEELPLTRTGKIDRNELSEWEPDWRVVVSATFTAELLEERLEFWFDQIGIDGEVVFAPYNQVFQQLLDPGSRSGRNAKGANVVLVRPEDWLRYLGQAKGGASEHLDRSATELIEALSQASARSAVPHLVVVCPAEGDPNEEIRTRLLTRLEGLSGVHVVTAEEIDAHYPVAEKFDSDSDEMGHIPYTGKYFMALASMLMRKMYAMMHTPKKVVVLDCDNTLWTGVVGEDGAMGVQIDAKRAALQRFMVRQQELGRLLCLCSKNAEADVLEVFEQHPDMLLKREHLVSWRINWSPKSMNIRELAAELSLGLDSFIFVDDNPVECAEVEASCPEVEVVLLPTDIEDLSRFLQQVWAFDVLKTTAEDRKRTRMYQQQIQREQLRRPTRSLEEFIEALELKIEINEMTASDLPRVSQLTQRTNQFNLTTIRRKEAELQRLLGEGHACRVVRVSDRFGDYGLVGVMIYRAGEATLDVDTFLLSCRVLDRGVEQRMVAALGEVARELGLEKIELGYRPTDRNQPVRKFLNTLAKGGGGDLLDGLLLEVDDVLALQGKGR